MGNAYSVTAFDYNEEDIGIDPDTEQKFVPNSKELELFKKEKMNLYKGTWTVCFVYGISAFILLAIVLFTDMGREYIYHKYLPAVLTYVFGAIIIIIYLVYSIFNIKPRKLGKAVRKQNNCPDYWKYKRVDTDVKNDIIENILKPSFDSSKSTTYILGDNKQYILNEKDHPEINRNTSNLFIDYKCVADENVFGTLEEQKIMKNYISGGTTFNDIYTKNEQGKPSFITTTVMPDTANPNDPIIDNLKKYAQVAGIYKTDYTSDGHLFNNSIKTKSSSITLGTYSSNMPTIICNEVYPNILTKLEKNDTTNDLRCKYAETCKISWSDLDCYKKPFKNY
jgi:hypothetical protein